MGRPERDSAVMVEERRRGIPFMLLLALLIHACSGGDGCSNDPRPGTADCTECSLATGGSVFDECFEDCYRGCDELLVSDLCKETTVLTMEQCMQLDPGSRPAGCECFACLSCIDECDGCPGDAECLRRMDSQTDPTAGRCGFANLLGVDCGDGLYSVPLGFDPRFSIPRSGTQDCEPCDLSAVENEFESCATRCLSGGCSDTVRFLVASGSGLSVGPGEADVCAVDPHSTDCERRRCRGCIDECLGCGIGAACLDCGTSCGTSATCGAAAFNPCDDDENEWCGRPVRCREQLFRLSPEIVSTLQILIDELD